MRCPAPDVTEVRGKRTLLLWGDPPFWMVVDRQAARLVQALARGDSLTEATAWATGRPATEASLAEAGQVLARLREVGLLGGRRRRPPAERIESITINVTNRCDLACRFCYNRERAAQGREATTEALIGALDSARRCYAPGGLAALLGGEPLLEPERTLALARWARGAGLRPLVSTNGTHVTRAFAEAACEIGLECQVSLDGATACSHDAVRGEGSWLDATRAVRLLTGGGAHTILSMVCHAGNWREAPAYLRLARELGASEARFIALKRIGGGEGMDAPEVTALLRLLAETARREPSLGALLGRDVLSVLARTCRECAPRQSCGAGSQTFLLDADGCVYPCINLAQPEHFAGDATRQPLSRILARSPVLARVRRESSLEGRAECQGCVVRHWCMGICRGETYAATGSLSARSVTCATNRETIQETMWLLTEHPELGERGTGHEPG